MGKALTTLVLLALLVAPAYAAEEFKDVPKDHWAAGAVKAVADAGVMHGYPNQAFKGDKTVTRYELAAALAQMIEFIQQSQKPLTPPKQSSTPKQNWGEQSMAFLKAGGFLPKNSPLLTKGDKPVTPDEMATALASVASKLIEIRVPPKTVED